MKRLFLVVGLLLLAGCATRQVRQDAANFVPVERAMGMQSPVAGGGAITIVRDAGMLGGGCYVGIFVNGQLVAKLSASEKVRLYLPSGRSVVAAHSVGAALCGMKMQARGERAAEVRIAAGDDLVYRLALSTDGTVSITPLVE